MKKNIYFVSIFIFLLSLMTYSCKKEGNPEIGQVEFSLMLDSQEGSLKSALSSGTASTVVVTIEDASGNVIKNSEKLELYNLSGSYITQPISLVNGNYKLTKFFVLDAENNVLYASPLQGSAKAILVTQALPLNFIAQTNSVTKLVPEVLTTAQSTPESFGYTTFSFNIAETFDFLVGTFIYNESLKNFQLTSGDISIFADSALVYSGKLTAKTNSINLNAYDSLGVTNKITLPERYNNYTLVISKAGYKTYRKTFTKGELKLHYLKIDKGPLIVVLEPESVVDTNFYIRGNFGGEYLNYTVMNVNNYVYTFNNPVNGNLHFVGYEKVTTGWCKSIGLFYSGNSFNLDSMRVPYALPALVPGDKIYAELQYSTGPVPVQFGPDDDKSYMATASSIGVSITLETKNNDIISGKFSGVIRTMTGLSMTVTDGEFRGKVNQVLIVLD